MVVPQTYARRPLHRADGIPEKPPAPSNTRSHTLDRVKEMRRLQTREKKKMKERVALVPTLGSSPNRKEVKETDQEK